MLTRMVTQCTLRLYCVEIIICQFSYHTPYQPETPISARDSRISPRAEGSRVYKLDSCVYSQYHFLLFCFDLLCILNGLAMLLISMEYNRIYHRPKNVLGLLSEIEMLTTHSGPFRDMFKLDFLLKSTVNSRGYVRTVCYPNQYPAIIFTPVTVSLSP